MHKYVGWSNEKLIERINSLEAQLLESTAGTRQSSPYGGLVKGSRSSPKPKKIKRTTSTKPFDFTKFEERYVAFKFAYLGWHYNGLVTQDMPTELPTVEEEIFNALLKTRLIESPELCKFSRCGRTDKGVSAMGQVMALNVRSARLKVTPLDDTLNELPWMEQLNGCLPSSIRILAYDDTISPEFDARFSCAKRHYKYLISPKIPASKALDKVAMQTACSYFLGEHDFRNFCKLDASKQITNFKRTILRCEISNLIPSAKLSNSTDNLGLYVLDLEGTAFLWHQVRCITGILLLIGQGHEKPELVKQLLDIDQTPTKPIYEMADDWPLTLYDCAFGDQVHWKYPVKNQRVLEDAFMTFHEHRIKDAISGFLVEAASAGVQEEEIKTGVLLGDGKLKVQKNYTPVMDRKRHADVTVLNAVFAEKQERKRAMQQTTQDDHGDEVMH